MKTSSVESIFVVGSYTSTNSTGISSFNFNSDSLRIDLIGTLKIPNASYLAYSAKQNLLLATNENGHINDSISVVQVDNGKLQLLSSETAHGSAPCYITV